MKIIRFCNDVIVEMKKVHWPGVHQTKIDTETVLLTSIAFAVFFGLIDWLIQNLLSLL